MALLPRMIDVAALAAALAPHLAELLAPAIADELERRAAARAADELVGLAGLAGLARLLGCSAAAAKARVHRDPGLAGLVLRAGGRRQWRTSEVLRLLDSRRVAR